MNQKLPKHILNALRHNHTSIGDHPALPPEDELTFLERQLGTYFGALADSNGNNVDIHAIQKELAESMTQCRHLESSVRENLEQLVQTAVMQVIDIPQDAIDIEVQLKDVIDASGERLFPENTEDYTFEDLDDIKSLTSQIYKRRFLDTLINGAAAFYSQDLEPYLSKLFRINPELPALYKKIARLNGLMLFLFDDTKMKSDATITSGTVAVNVGARDTRVSIHAEGMTFPTLLFETFKGLFELAISHGLPDDRNKAEYVMKKADFRFAEIWDQRIGFPLWCKLDDCMRKSGNDPVKVGVMYILMEIARMEPDEFNPFMQEVLAKTRKGIGLMAELAEKIGYSKERDEFDDFMQAKSSEMTALSDSEFFTPEELIADSIENSEHDYGI